MRRELALAVVSLLLISGCADEVTGPVNGTLQVQLTSPNLNDGAVLFTVSGDSIQSVEAAGYATFSRQISPTEIRVLVAGDIHPGLLVRLQVPDIRGARNYAAVLEQVASRDTYAPADVTGYGIEVTR